MPEVEDINVEEELGNRDEGLEGRPSQPGEDESEGEDDGEELSFGVRMPHAARGPTTGPTSHSGVPPAHRSGSRTYGLI